MARVNVGVNPRYLSDQHLIAESVEITMITGGLRKNGYQIKSPIPDKFALGKGHINFFKNKIAYLQKRLQEVNKELNRRGIRNSTVIDLSEFPEELWYHPECYPNSDIFPNIHDSMRIRRRITERLINPLKAKPGFHRYQKQPIEDMQKFAYELFNSELFYV